MMRTASGALRGPRPNATSAGAAMGTAAEVSIFCRRLPARISTLAPTAPLLETRPTSCSANERLRLPPSFTSRRRARGVATSASASPSASRSATARAAAAAGLALRSGGDGRGADVGPGRPQVAQEPRPLRGDHQEVEKAVVVVVDELGGEGARGRPGAGATPNAPRPSLRASEDAPSAPRKKSV